MKKERNIWVSLFLSLLSPGLGQFYNGQLIKALVFAVLLMLSHLMFPFLSGTAFFLGIGVWGVLILAVAAEAVYHSRKLVMIEPRPFQKWPYYLLFILCFNFFKPEVPIKIYRIKAESMAQTLTPGQRLHVNKYAYGLPFWFKSSPLFLTAPERGDIIVFIAPETPKKLFIQRVIATAGDVVEIQGERVFINGKPERDDYLFFDPKADVKLIQKKVKIPSGNMWVMGDNRRVAHDSRSWGVVPITSVKGKLVEWDKD